MRASFNSRKCMFKSSYLFVFAFFISVKLFAQADSIAIVNAKWSSKELAPKVVWKTLRFSNKQLFGANENINLIELLPGSKAIRLIIAHSDSLETTSQQAKRHDALAGINGSFFQMRGADPDNHADLKSVPKLQPSKLDHNRSHVYLREDNQLITGNERGKSKVRQRSMQGTIAVTDRNVLILKPDSVNFDWENTIMAKYVLTSGPLMLMAGKYLQIPNDAFCNNRHPRTALGKKADGTVVLFVVDGRFAESEGMSIPELQKTLRWLGCTEAINLDGGGSTAMYIKGQANNGIVNYPSDNKKFDHAGEREVANTLLLVGDR